MQLCRRGAFEGATDVLVLLKPIAEQNFFVSRIYEWDI